ncbi:MAG: sodium:panthothenate symporter [Lentisphaeria bacterium]|nr:sodium:panthothenate symporter [Lentisphaeria bacterium]
MSIIDWLIVLIPLSIIIWFAVRAKRYARGVVDFLAAGRVAGRYVISVGDLTAGLSVITLVAGAEQNYQTGYGVAFWNHVLAPVGVILALLGWMTYRWRETRCLSKGQFIEMRYGSKSFRIVTAIVSTVSEMVTNAIGPAIATNFFIYYLGLPHRIMICGINLPCYAIIVALCLTLAMILIWPAGRISLLITDSFQAIMCYPIFVLIVGFILLKFSWGTDIAPTLASRVPNQSFLNPYDISQLRDFNLFAIIVTLLSAVLNRGAWIGNDTTNSGRTPHEQKMAGIFGSFRTGFSTIMITLVAITVIVFMNNGTFAKVGGRNPFKVTNNEIRRNLSAQVLDEVLDGSPKSKEISEKIAALPDVVYTPGKDAPLSQQKNLENRYLELVRAELGDTPQGRHEFQQFRTLYHQMMMPVTMGRILPVGLLGLFCLLMVMLLISTDDSRIFNAAGCLVQDVILPFYKGHLSPQKHLLILRLTSLGVSIFFFIVAVFFSQMDYIIMFTTIMCALWLGGAGPIMVGGLYTRFGNLTGAWCAIIFGSGTSLLGLIFQRNWAKTIYPWLEQMNWVEPLDKFLVTVSNPFNPWIVWKMDSVKFPINSYEVFFISMVLAVGTYILGSYLTYKPYDLDKLLHRGKYSDGETLVAEPWTIKTLWSKLIGITPEYTKGDRCFAWALFFYSVVYQFIIIFVVVVIWNLIKPWPASWWSHYFFITTLVVPGIIGVISTFWFMIGGTLDIRQLFIDLAKRVDNPLDNGQIIDGEAHNDK